MDTYNYNDMCRQDRLSTLLGEIVLGQLQAGHFEVVKAALKFQNNVPCYVMDGLVQNCTVVIATAESMSEKQRRKLLNKNLPIATIGQYAQLQVYLQRWMEGCIGEFMVVDERSLYCAIQHLNLCDIVLELAHALHMPQAAIEVLEDAKKKVISYRYNLQTAYDQKLAEERDKQLRKLEAAAAR